MIFLIRLEPGACSLDRMRWVFAKLLPGGHVRRARRLGRSAAVCVVLGLFAWMRHSAAQEPALTAVMDHLLPDAPDAANGTEPANDGTTAPKPGATVSGTVLDTNGAVVEGAQVELRSAPGTPVRKTQSGSNGQFLFNGVPAGKIRLTVTGNGWGRFVSPEMQVRDGEFQIVPDVVLPVATTVSNVTVVADKEEIAQEQVHIALQQRVLGVFPNFYSSYDWNAPPMMAKQKFELALRSAVDPVTFLAVGGVAGAEQLNNKFPGYGGGWQGYAKRYGAAYADDTTSNILGKAVFPAMFHQDPRYFYRGSGSAGSRLYYALSAAVMTRSDSGRWEPNYSFVLGSFVAGGISNLYYPAGDRGAALTIENGFIDIAAHAGGNVVREFVLKRFSSRARDANP